MQEKNKSVAIIDIGSNSLRTVVYDSISIHPRIIFKDKFPAEFARGLEKTKKIKSENITRALKYLKHLILQLNHLKVSQKIILATSAMRQASNAKEFALPAEKILKSKIKIITDQEEAQLSAYAAIFETANPQGIIADIGGGSLELSLVSGTKIKKTASLKIGYQILADIGSLAEIRKYIKKELSKVKWLKGNSQLYLIGGKWRKLAKHDIARKKYPVKIISNYSLSSIEIKSLCNIANKDFGTKNRESFLTLIAATVLDELNNHTKASKIFFCSNSIREGFIYKNILANKNINNLLIESGIKYVNEIGCYPEKFTQLKKITLLLKTKFSKIMNPDLLELAILLSDIAKYERINFRPEFAFMRVLYAPIYGLEHSDRVLLAFTIYHRYESSIKNSNIKNFMKFLSKTEIKLAKDLGDLMKDFYAGL